MKDKKIRIKNKTMLTNLRSKTRLFYFLFTGSLGLYLVLIIPQLAYTFSISSTSSSPVKMLAQRPSNSSTDEESQIKSVVLEKLRDDAVSGVTPQVKRVTIVDNYAIADWLLGEAGGSAVLAKKKGDWIFLAPGGGVYNVEELQQQFGIPENTANKLVQMRLQCIKSPSRCSGS